MKNNEKNRDPERARKRASADLRCAIRKLGGIEALKVFADMPEEGEALRALRGVAYCLTGNGANASDFPTWWDHDAGVSKGMDRLRAMIEGGDA